MNSQDIITKLLEDGWYRVKVRGSHWQFKHHAKPGKVTVPHPKKDVPKGTIHNMEKQSGLKLR